MPEELLNYIDGTWTASAASAAAAAFKAWRRTPVVERTQPLFRLKTLLEANIDDLTHSITRECGKTHAESRGELQRAIENIEIAGGMPILMQGTNSEDVASGIDEHMIRQPLGVAAAITPFNFPAMIPFWFLPYAVASGNCFILKPSERVPITSQNLFRLIERAGFPASVLQLVNGGRDAVNAILKDPDIRAISFVCSTQTARYIYHRAAETGKRAACQGGPQNPVVIMPDADLEMTPRILADSAFGCAGQRCLAASIAVTVGDGRPDFTEQIVNTAERRKVGRGADAGVGMGPVISAESKARIQALIERGQSDGARVLTTGSNNISADDNGYFVFPTVLDKISPDSELARTEVFGPVLSLMHAATIEEAIDLVTARSYGNMACIFTRAGGRARRFRYEVQAVNVGAADPMSTFPFSGWGESFFGDLHAQAHHSVEFYTQTKVVVEGWPKEWSRTF